MLDALWNWILQMTSLLVMPDWGALIALIPVAIMVMVVVWLIWMIRRFRAQPKARRGKAPVPRTTPAGIHMPGPSFAPIFAAIGVALTFFGLVWGGPILILGIVALVLTLLYWLAEGMRIYDHDIADTTTTLPAVVHDGPPPGVHMPGPSFRPILGALGMAILFFGLVYGGWMLVAGVLALVATLVGWLVDAVADYRRTVQADETGHLESGPAPRTPSLMFSVLAVVFVGAILLQTGLLPPRAAEGSSGGASPSGAPSGSASPSGGPAAPSAPAASGAPSGGPAPSGAPGAGTTLTVQAKNIAFTTATLTAPANSPITITFDNQDAGVPHNIQIFKDSVGGTKVFEGKVFPGVATESYQVGPLPAGTYPFDCFVHPTMTGTLTVQ